jgi:hypothetical protein
MIKRIFISLFLIIEFFPVLYAQPKGHTDVIMQGFYWNTNPGDVTDPVNGGVWWDSLSIRTPMLKYAGFNTVWIPSPVKGQLNPAYPNPFNSTSQIEFAVPTEQNVSVELYNTLGQRVQTLFAGKLAANTLQSATINGANLVSGTYFVRFTGLNFTSTQKVVMMK